MRWYSFVYIFSQNDTHLNYKEHYMRKSLYLRYPDVENYFRKISLRKAFHEIFFEIALLLGECFIVICIIVFILYRTFI